MRWLIALLRRRRESRELAAEIRAHLDEKIDTLMAGGLSRTDATRAARLAFGSVDAVTEAGRDTWRVAVLDTVVSDLTHAVRLIRRHPAFAANVILVSALGVAACTTTFSVVSGVLLSPLGFPGAEHVFELQVRSADGDETAAVPMTVYERVAHGLPVVEASTVTYGSQLRVDWGGEPELIRAERVTPSYFQVFGVTPVLGRPFTEGEGERMEPVALLGHDAWRRRFHGDSSVVGQSVTLDGSPYTVIGVMPSGFRAAYAEEPAFWLPTRVGSGGADGRFGLNIQLRLPVGIDSARAMAVIAALTHIRMASRRSRDSVAAQAELLPIAERVRGEVDRPLRIVLAAVLTVLALVATNVATMLLARGTAREEEFALRGALGANRWRQAQLLVTESIALAAIGGGSGIAVSVWAVRAIRGLGVAVLPRMDAVTVDGRVLLFATAATALIGLIGGVAPVLLAPQARALRASRSRITGSASATLVVAQVGLSVLLLVGAGLLTKGFLRVLPSDPGFETQHRATIAVDLERYPGFPKADSGGARQFLDAVRHRMRALPGVTDVAAMSFAPLSGIGASSTIEVVDRPPADRPLRAWSNVVTTNWLEIMRIPLRQGRGFTEADGPTAPAVAIINEEAAARWWPGEASVVGRQLVVDGNRRRAVTIVGVSANARFVGSDSRSRAELYLPAAQANPRFLTFIAATTGDPGAIVAELKHAVWAEAPQLPIAASSDLEAIALNSVRRPRFFAWALGSFALAAVTLTALAVYGLLSFSVAGRRREIGVRLALGATPARVGGAVVLRAVRLGVAGIALGIIGGLVLTRFMESMLVEVQPRDGTVFAGAALATLVIAIGASSAPAWRALRVDPAATLRSE